MPDFTDNQAILQAILGTGAAAPSTTLGTGTFDPNPSQQQFGGQLPQLNDPTQMNPNVTGTQQQFFGTSNQPPTFNNPIQTQPRHAVGRDSWTSSMGLDPDSILRNIGAGGQNAR